ncbi:MAG: hypothetical protein EHM17_10060 [Verrucomicrobiaceae bacterium]|nr:MAG: hypothetical protein EHM17_10060 [Verrucomicrobiaceae bacterium]
MTPLWVNPGTDAASQRHLPYQAFCHGKVVEWTKTRAMQIELFHMPPTVLNSILTNISTTQSRHSRAINLRHRAMTN